MGAMDKEHAGAAGSEHERRPPGLPAQSEAEEQFRRAVEDAPIPMIMHAEDGQVLQISRSWTELTGYTLADIPTVDAWLNRAYSPGAQAVRAHMHDLFAGNRRTLDVAFEIQTRSGEVRHWRFSASSPGTLRDGRRFIVGMAVDMTERTRVEQALAEQARLLDLSNDAIIVRDTDNRIIYWNRGATELYGWSRDEAIGQDLHTLLRTEFERPFAEMIALLKLHNRMEGEVVQVTKDGRCITVWSRWALDRDAEGRPGAILTTYNDITERKRMEQALRESETRFRTLVENIQDYAIFMLNPAGIITNWTRGAERVKGYTADEVIGRHISLFYPPEELAAGQPDQELAEAAATGRVEREGWRIRKDGTCIWVNQIATAIRDAEGVLIGFTKISRDLTERRQADAALREALAAEQTARAELEAAVQAREQFLSIASHELRTPLTSLLGSTELLRRAVEQGQDISTRTLERTIRQTRRLDTLINQLLDISRVQRGQFALERQPLDLVALTAHVVDDVRTTLPPTGPHTLELDHPEQPVLILGDAQRLEQVLENLLSNAIKYSPQGGRIQVRVDQIEGGAVLEVTDVGIGIPAEALPQLFDSFYRAANVGTQISGFGLGLYVVQEIVQRHGGHITVESHEDVGTTVRVRLPLLLEQAAGMG